MESFIIDTDRLVNKIETENVYDNFSKNKEILYFSNYSANSKYYNDSNTLVVAKRKYEMAILLLNDLLD